MFQLWRTALAQLLVTGGLTEADADGFAATLIASSEGAVVLSRAQQSMEPFDTVSKQLLSQVSSFGEYPRAQHN